MVLCLLTTHRLAASDLGPDLGAMFEDIARDTLPFGRDETVAEAEVEPELPSGFRKYRAHTDVGRVFFLLFVVRQRMRWMWV